MATSEIGLTIVDGRRRPFDAATDVLLTARNGRQKNVISQFVNCDANGQIHLTQLPVEGNFADSYTVLLSAKHRSDAGFTPVKLEANTPKPVALMLLPRTPKFQFDAFADLAAAHPNAHALVSGESTAQKARAVLRRIEKQAAAGVLLLNITTALEQMTLSPASGLDVLCRSARSRGCGLTPITHRSGTGFSPGRSAAAETGARTQSTRKDKDQQGDHPNRRRSQGAASGSDRQLQAGGLRRR